MPKKLYIHISVIAVTLGIVLYVSQNCGQQSGNTRSSGSSSGGDASEGNSVESRYANYTLSIDLGQENLALNPAGLNLTTQSVSGFVALLFCSNLEVPSKITVSPISISANSTCIVGLQEINLGAGAGVFMKLGAAREIDFNLGSASIFQNAAGAQIIVEVLSQLSLSGEKATASFRFYQIQRSPEIAKEKLKTVSIAGSLAPQFSVASVILGVSNFGTVVRTAFKCTAIFAAASTGVNKPFTCGSSSIADLKFLFETLPKQVNLDALQSTNPSVVDGPEGILAQLAALAGPLVDFAPETTADGFIVTKVLPDIASGKFSGFPEEILIGVSNRQGGTALVEAQIGIQ